MHRRGYELEAQLVREGGQIPHFMVGHSVRRRRCAAAASPVYPHTREAKLTSRGNVVVPALRYVENFLLREVEPPPYFMEVRMGGLVAANLLRCNDGAEVDTELDR